MRDPSALQEAFNGCNTTLETACSEAGILKNDFPAVLDLLGTRLMEEAASCLPSQIDSKIWLNLSASSQLATLRELMESLCQPPVWRRRSKQPIARRPLLPTEMGPWKGGKRLPSCGGMLVNMAAYARLTGTKALAASVQRPSSELAMPGMIDLFTTARSFSLRHFPGAATYDQLPGELAQSLVDAKSATSGAANERYFHGAILFRIIGGTWASLDPYLGNFAQLRPPLPPIDRVWRGLTDPADAAMFRGPSDWQDLPGLTRQLTDILQFIPNALASPRMTPEASIPDLARHVEAVSARVGIPLTSWEDVVAFSVTTPPEWTVPDRPTALARASAATGDERRQIQERILLNLLHVWAEKVRASARKVHDTQPHQAMLVGNLPRSLAVWTLINLRHRTGGLLGADLLEYSKSDVVLLNAMLDQDAGRTIPSEDHRIADLVSIYSQTPDGMMHPLMARLVA